MSMSMQFNSNEHTQIDDRDSADLTEVATEVLALRNTARQASNAHGREVEAIREDASLSEHGQRERIAELEAAHSERRNALIAQEKQIIADKITTLERRLDGFVGWSSDNIMAFRDAQDRAESIDDPDKAAAVMARALRTSDRTLAHALYRRAVENNWAEARHAFAADNPTVAALVEDVAKLHGLRAASFNRAVAYM